MNDKPAQEQAPKKGSQEPQSPISIEQEPRTTTHSQEPSATTSTQELQRTLEKNLAKLRAIGVKEISHHTKITTTRINDILDSRFDNIQRVHLVGFLQILEREYRVDLSAVIQAYDRHHNSPHAPIITDEQKPQKHIHKLSLDTQKQRYDAIDERKKQDVSKQKFYITLVIVVIVIFCYLIYQNITSKHPSSTPSTQIERAQETESNINESIQDATPSNSSSENIAPQTSSQTNTNTTQQSSSSATASSSPPSSNASATASQMQATASQASPSSTPSTQEAESSTQISALDSALQSTRASRANANNAMVISTDTDLWFDVIDLDTNRRKYQGITNNTYAIKTNNHRWLLAFGHSNFSLTMNGEPFTFTKSNYPLYFIYEPDSGFRKISQQIYKSLSEQI